MKPRAAALALSVIVASSTVRADPAAARAALLRGDLDGARQALAHLTAAQRAEGTLLRARIAWETGAYEDAARLAATLSRTPLRARAQTLEGEALLALGRYDDALARWRDAARVPGAWRASALSAMWLRRLGRDDEAREAANVLLDAYNDAVDGRAGARANLLRDTEFLASVALAARALGAAADANRALNEALRVSPEDPELHLAQADLMRSTEDYEPAGEAVAAALRVNPRSPRALLLRARLRVLSGHDAARITEDLDAAARGEPAPRGGPGPARDGRAARR
jgi:tetratricopeptide (TPR) repeat protein